MPIYNTAQDYANAFAVVFATNYVYNVHFREGQDFSHIALESSPHWTDSDKPVIIRFNYSATRELFDVKRITAGSILDSFPLLKNAGDLFLA